MGAVEQAEVCSRTSSWRGPPAVAGAGYFDAVMVSLGCIAVPARRGAVSTVHLRCAMSARAGSSGSTATRSGRCDNTEVPLITPVDVTAASEQDGPLAADRVDRQPEDRRPARLLGDSAYATGPVRGELSEHDVGFSASAPGCSASRRPASQARLSDRSRRGHSYLPGGAPAVRQHPVF